ncbi:MAG: hypothetical protein EXS36_06810 [Pedosphaera sp.]|nr:hypothetical protein [Pedosphaera sp.]
MTLLAMLFAVILPRLASAVTPSLVFACESSNDVFQVLAAQGQHFPRHATGLEAVNAAAEGDGVLILAQDYPAKTTRLSDEIFAIAERKKLRLYVEFPSTLPGLTVGAPRGHKRGPYGSNIDREVVTSDAFGTVLRRSTLLMVHGCRFVPVPVPPTNSHIVAAQVAGYNNATFGLPAKEVWPILFQHPDRPVLVATTKLSHFITGRYAPTEAWEPVWLMILRWLQPGIKPSRLTWTPMVRPAYSRAGALPGDVELQALTRGIDWFGRSRLMIEPNGRKGFKEGYSSKEFFMDGSHAISTQVRTDCHGEVAMSLALGAAITGNTAWGEVATNLLELIYRDSMAGRGPRLDPKHPAYGLVGGDLMVDSGVYYGDDSCRHLLGTVAAAAVLKTPRWDDRAALEMLANFRTTGPSGFRQARIDEPELVQKGWRWFWEKSDGHWGGQRLVPHYQAYPWATMLWLYDKTRFEPLLRRTEQAIRTLMDAFPDGWGSEATRHETERCRMLLPLAWLVRVEDTPEHRDWLRQIVRYVIAAQHASGAIRQRVLRETTANSQYGTDECALIQANGDPCCDLLYAVNFAFIGLHEAASATGDPEILQAENRLADFLVRIQIRSEARPELDGAWYRGFDFEKWDYWGSDGDVGWGVWCIETGWTQGWITSTLALRHLKTSLWDLTAASRIAGPFAKHRPGLLPDDALVTPEKRP